MNLPRSKRSRPARAPEGFDEVLERKWQPSLVLDTHTHPFAVKALVVEGDVAHRRQRCTALAARRRVCAGARRAARGALRCGRRHVLGSTTALIRCPKPVPLLFGGANALVSHVDRAGRSLDWLGDGRGCRVPARSQSRR